MYKNLILVSLFAFAGCSLKQDMPKLEYEYQATDKSAISQKWWMDFNDQKLNILIDKALKNNLNLKMAYLHVKAASKNLALTNKDYLPNLSASLGSTRTQNSGEISEFSKQSINNNFSISGLLSYEVDLWGRVKNASSSASSILKATKYDYESAKLTISSLVAKSYFNLIGFDMQKNILLQTLDTYNQSVQYQKNQFQAGEISKLNYLQSKAEYDSAKIKLDTIEKNIQLAQSALSLLVGQSLDDIMYLNSKYESTLPKDVNVPSDISSSILLNRSDVASAYERVKSANYQIAISKSEYLPTLSLTGAFGYQSSQLDDFLISNANIWSLGASLVGKVFDFGRTDLKVQIAKINEDINVANYNITVRSALNEIRNSLINRQNAINIKQSSQKFLNSQQKIYELSKSMYEEGYISNLEYLDAKRLLLSAKIQYSTSCIDVTNSLVDVFKAFGGGFIPVK